MLKIISKIPDILSRKHKLLLLILFFWTLIMSFAEILGLGSLVLLVSIINDPEMIINKLSSFNLDIGIENFVYSKLITISCFFLIIVFSIKTLISIIFNYFAAKITMSINYSISSSFFKNYLKKNYEEYLKLNSTKFSNDIKDETSRFITFLFAFINIIRDSFLVLLILITLMLTSSNAALIIFIIILILSVIIFLSLKKIIRAIGVSRSKFNTQIYNILKDTFDGIKNIKLIGAENLISKNFDRHINNFLKNNLTMRILNPLPRIFLEWVAIVGISALILIFNYQFENLKSFLPVLTFIAVASIRLIPAFSAINQNIGHLNYNLNATSLILKELRNKKELHKKIFSKKIKINSINLKNVSYKYIKDQQNILNNINFKIKKGQLIGIIGTSGSGKTTLAEIILGLISPSKGKMYINNKTNIHNTNIFKNSLSYVSQDIFLFEGSLLENITFGNYNKKIDKDLLFKIFKFCELETLIKKSKEGINLRIKENGKNISGGEMQRIAIARALFREPELMVLDEATSSLDIKTEKKIIDNLKYFTKGRIIFMVAHRLTSLKHCDKLMLMENGRIIDFAGTKKILKKYKELNRFIKLDKN
jgi:ATP-binding cassette, subfamily B, bacterial PglK